MFGPLEDLAWDSFQYPALCLSSHPKLLLRTSCCCCKPPKLSNASTYCLLPGMNIPSSLLGVSSTATYYRTQTLRNVGKVIKTPRIMKFGCLDGCTTRWLVCDWGLSPCVFGMAFLYKDKLLPLTQYFRSGNTTSFRREATKKLCLSSNASTPRISAPHNITAIILRTWNEKRHLKS